MAVFVTALLVTLPGSSQAAINDNEAVMANTSVYVFKSSLLRLSVVSSWAALAAFGATHYAQFRPKPRLEPEHRGGRDGWLLRAEPCSSADRQTSVATISCLVSGSILVLSFPFHFSAEYFLPCFAVDSGPEVKDHNVIFRCSEEHSSKSETSIDDCVLAVCNFKLLSTLC